MMKRLITAFFIFSAMSLMAQGIQGVPGFEGVFNASAVLNMSPIGKDLDNAMTEEEKKKLLEKQYLTQAYNPALIDDFTTTAFLRYNLYNDQMEFVKNDKIYYMEKDKGRRVRFTTLNTLYKVYDLYGDLSFFLVKEEGEKASLLVKQETRFIAPKKAQSTYGVDKKANFKRRADVYFVAMGDKLVKLPKKKKEIPAIFGRNAKEVKTYIKKEKLNPKKDGDLKKIIKYYNTL